MVTGGQGAEIIYALRNNDTFSKKIASEFENVGQNVRKYYQKRLPSNPSKDYYYLLRDTPNNETVIVEYGFVDNEKDANLIKNDWEALAEAVVKATVEYAGGTYVPIKGSNYYKVVSGDSLWSIAKKYNISVEDLKKENNLTSNLIQIGQILYFPEAKEESITKTYTVVKGDTLWAIANKHGITVDELKKLNNLSSNALSIGQILKLPEKEVYETYIVTKGDTLYSISRKYNTTVTKLQNINNLSSSNLSIGQKLLIPKL